MRRRVLVISSAMIPVAGVADQAIVGALSMPLAIGILIGSWSASRHTHYSPTHQLKQPIVQPQRPASHDAARWISMRATAIVMPVLVLVPTNPSFHVAAIMKIVALNQQTFGVDAPLSWP